MNFKSRKILETNCSTRVTFRWKAFRMLSRDIDEEPLFLCLLPYFLNPFLPFFTPPPTLAFYLGFSSPSSSSLEGTYHILCLVQCRVVFLVLAFELFYSSFSLNFNISSPFCMFQCRRERSPSTFFFYALPFNYFLFSQISSCVFRPLLQVWLAIRKRD